MNELIERYGNSLFYFIYAMVGNYNEAEKFIQKSVNKEPDNSTLYDHLGDVLNTQGKKKMAIQNWKKALELDQARKEIQEKIKKAEQ